MTIDKSPGLLRPARFGPLPSPSPRLIDTRFASVSNGRVVVSPLTHDSTLATALDDVPQRTTEAARGVPAVVSRVVANLADRHGTIHEGIAGARALRSGDAMTPDTILSLFSCTKAITGVALMRCVEDGLVSLGDRADRHVPEVSYRARQNGTAGFRGTQILPFHDIPSYPGFVEFETTVYQHLSRKGSLRDA